MYDKLLQEDKRPLQTSIHQLSVSKPTQQVTFNTSEEKTRYLETKETRNQETYKPTNLQTKEPSKKVSLDKKKPTKQYNTILTIESIQAIKRLALEEDKKDYEVVQEAIDQLLKKKAY